MKVTRADWAGSVPWEGVTGKPSSVDGGTDADISALKARVAALEAALSGLPSTPTTTTLLDYDVWWLVGDLEPLQMAYEDVSVPGAPAYGQYAFNAPFSTNTGVFFSAYSLGAGYVRLIAVNLSGATITVPMAKYALYVLNG